MPAAFPPLLTSSRSDGLVGEVAPGVGTLRVAQQDSLPMLAPSEPSTVDPRVHAGRPSLDASRAVARVTARPCEAHLVAAARVHMRVVGGRVAVSVLPAQAGGGIAPASPGVPETGCSDVGSPPETGGGTTQCSARSASVGVVGIGGVAAERARTAGSVDLLACSEADRTSPTTSLRRHRRPRRVCQSALRAAPDPPTTHHRHRRRHPPSP